MLNHALNTIESQGPAIHAERPDSSLNQPLLPERPASSPGEMEYIAGQINELLGGRKFTSFGNIKAGPQELQYGCSNMVTQVGPYLFVVVGQPEEFVEKGQDFLKQRLRRVELRLNGYLESYRNNIFLVPASHTVPIHRRKDFPLSPHTALMAAQIAALPKRDSPYQAADLACGDGVLTHMLLVQGAAKVFMIDYDEELLSMAGVLHGNLSPRVRCHSLGKAEQSSRVNVLKQDLWYLDEWKEQQDKIEVVALNLGPFYDSERPLHERVLNELSFWPKVKVLLSGGYHLTEAKHLPAYEWAAARLSQAGYTVQPVEYRSVALLAAMR